jgi:hypothetical protein
LVITWRDPPGWLNEILLGVMKYGVYADHLLCLGRRVQAGILGQGNSDAEFVSAFDVILPNLALVTR